MEKKFVDIKLGFSDEWWGFVYTCPHCGAQEIWKGFTFCPMCGNEIFFEDESK